MSVVVSEPTSRKAHSGRPAAPSPFVAIASVIAAAKTNGLPVDEVVPVPVVLLPR